jgi:hypothetical protein
MIITVLTIQAVFNETEEFVLSVDEQNNEVNSKLRTVYIYLYFSKLNYDTSLFRLSSGMHLLQKRLQDCPLVALVLPDGSTTPQLNQFLLFVEMIDRSDSGNKPYNL